MAQGGLGNVQTAILRAQHTNELHHGSSVATLLSMVRCCGEKVLP
jgi:hypothetical protein